MSSLEEQKTFCKASRLGYSRAATGRGAGCRLARAKEKEKWLYQQQQAPTDMQTCQSIRACLRREVPTDREARSQAQRRQQREREMITLARVEMTLTELPRELATKAERTQNHDRPHPGAQRERTRAVWRRGKVEPERPSAGTNDLHGQRLEGEVSGAGQSSRPHVKA